MAVGALMMKQALMLTTWLTQPECQGSTLCTSIKIAAKSLFVSSKPFRLSDGLLWGPLMKGSYVQEVFEMCLLLLKLQKCLHEHNATKTQIDM